MSRKDEELTQVAKLIVATIYASARASRSENLSSVEENIKYGVVAAELLLEKYPLPPLEPNG